VALNAVSSLGFKPGAEVEENREAWENYVQLSREAFEHLAQNVTPVAHKPVEANRLASQAFQHAFRRAQSRAGTGAVASRRGPSGRKPQRFAGKTRVVRAAPGERIVIIGAAKVIVKGS
jgi:hypothetical protein